MKPECDDFDFEPIVLAEGEAEARLIVDLDGFEGPLDLMLDLARRNKLDLSDIPILALADQYLAYIRAAQNLKLEIAGDYLVMAAWLTYLKSRQMLPRRVEEAAADPLVEDLAARLQRLDTIRRAGALLADRLALARETFARGAEDQRAVPRRLSWEVSLVDLATAYAERRLVQAKSHYHIAPRRTLSIPEAREILARLIGNAAEWCPIDVLLAAIRMGEADGRSTRASTFVAALELAREGRVELRQDEAFAPLMVRVAAGKPVS